MEAYMKSRKSREENDSSNKYISSHSRNTPIMSQAKTVETPTYKTTSMQTTHFEGGKKNSDQHLDLTIMDKYDLIGMDEHEKQSLLET